MMGKYKKSRRGNGAYMYVCVYIVAVSWHYNFYVWKGSDYVGLSQNSQHSFYQKADIKRGDLKKFKIWKSKNINNDMNLFKTPINRTTIIISYYYYYWCASLFLYNNNAYRNSETQLRPSMPNFLCPPLTEIWQNPFTFKLPFSLSLICGIYIFS